MSTKIKMCKDFVQGDSFKIKISHNPTIDLTNGVFQFSMKKSENSSGLVLFVSHNVGDDINDDPTNGIVYIPIPKEKTILVPPGSYYGSIKRLLGSDVVTLLRSGKDNVDTITVYRTLVENV